MITFFTLTFQRFFTLIEHLKAHSQPTSRLTVILYFMCETLSVAGHVIVDFSVCSIVNPKNSNTYMLSKISIFFL